MRANVFGNSRRTKVWYKGKIGFTVSFFLVAILVVSALLGSSFLLQKTSIEDIASSIEHEGVMSFAYKLSYSWYYLEGGYVTMVRTDKNYSDPTSILFNLTTAYDGWGITPYDIPLPEFDLWVIGQAKTKINLGNIPDGTYTPLVIMEDAVDRYEVHKTHNMFWVEEISSTYGVVEEKEDFDKRLDAFTAWFLDGDSFAKCYGQSVKSSEMKNYTLNRIKELGGTIIGEQRDSVDTNALQVRFYFEGEPQDLRQIIIDLAKMDPCLHISIVANTHWSYHSWTLYNFVIIVYKLSSFRDIRNILREEGMNIWNEDTWPGSRGGSVYYSFYVSSEPTGKVAFEIQNTLINTISNKLGLTYKTDFKLVPYSRELM